MCGKCCKELPIEVFASDIRRWLFEKRYDILEQVSFLDNYPSLGTGGFYVIETVKAPKRPCPFLNQDGLCSIHNTKPRICRDYPLGYTGWKSCPYMNKSDVTERKARRLRKKQIRDLKDTLMNKTFLLKQLIEARGEVA